MGFGAAEDAMCSAGCVKFMGLATGTLLGQTSVALNVDGATVTAEAAIVTGRSGAGSDAEDRARLPEECSALRTASKMRLKANLLGGSSSGWRAPK
jgi:hypothetical protein